MEDISRLVGVLKMQYPERIELWDKLLNHEKTRREHSKELARDLKRIDSLSGEEIQKLNIYHTKKYLDIMEESVLLDEEVESAFRDIRAETKAESFLDLMRDNFMNLTEDSMTKREGGNDDDGSEDDWVEFDWDSDDCEPDITIEYGVAEVTLPLNEDGTINVNLN